MLGIAAIPAFALAVTIAGTPAALSQYRASLDRYVFLRDAAVAALPVQQRCAGPEQLEIERTLLADEIRRARAAAREGDIFTPAVALVLRLRLLAAAGDAELLPDDVFAPPQDEARHIRPVAINGAFPWEAGRPLFHTLFLALPGLPEPLEYRLYRGDLVLLDVEANLVVDVLRDALR